MPILAPKPKSHIRALIRHRKAVIECDPEDYGRLREIFAFRHPSADFMPKVRDGTWDGMIHLLKRGSVPAGLFRFRQRELDREFSLTVSEESSRPGFRPAAANAADPATGKPMRPYQRRAVEAMIAASGLGGIILSATGSGKTLLAGNYFQRLEGPGVFVVDELTLLEQSRREIAKAAGEEVGIVGKSIFAPRRVTVATIQTLFKHRNRPDFRRWFESLDAVIIDELHVALNKRNIDIVTWIKPKAVFGLTATLQMDKPHIAMPATALCGPVIFKYSIQEGVSEGYLSKGKVFVVPFYDPLRGLSPGYWSTADGVKNWIEQGTPPAVYRRHICLNKARNDLIERLVRKALKEGRMVIVLVLRRLHLQMLHKRFGDVPHYTLDGTVDSRTRLQAMKEMDAGRMNLILASRVFAKGVDVQRVDTIIDATGASSHDNVIQRYGRGVRRHESKGELVFYDIADRNSSFADAAYARIRALQETGAPIETLELA